MAATSDTKQKTSVEFGVDLKFIKASRKTEKESDENRFTRLDAVVDYLEVSGRLGTLNEQKEYVRAAMAMQFAPWGTKGRVTHLGSTNDVSPQQAAFACFVGRTDKYQAVLWGSWKHVLGENMEGAHGQFLPSTSLATLAMWDYLNRLEQDDEWSRTNEEDERVYLSKLRNRADHWRGMNVNIFQVYTKVDQAPKIPCILASALQFELRGPEQGMEFVAKKMQYGALGDGVCFLGTPLYVAIT